MRILILNGSPAGNASITLQTMEYIKVLFPDHEYETIHVGQQIRSIEKDFSEAREALERAELIVFCYPVYTFLAPAQLHRFIELMKDSIRRHIDLLRIIVLICSCAVYAGFLQTWRICCRGKGRRRRVLFLSMYCGTYGTVIVSPQAQVPELRA